MKAELAAAILRFETLPFPQMIDATFDLYKPYHEVAPYAGIAVDRDIAYGPDPRHRLDVLRSDVPGADLPIVLFVHGGGFVRGDKTLPGLPYNENVPLWCARQGFIGVNMTYRLAPAATFPAGGDDIAAAVSWIRNNIAAFGGSAESIVVFGQSAGAAHAATYVARHPAAAQIAGVVLLSGVYDFRIGEPPPNEIAYVGTGDSRPALTTGVATAGVPLLLGISELDPPMFHRQAHALIDAWIEEHQHLPHILFFPKHNHISQIAHLNARDVDDSLLAVALTEFVERVSR